MEGGGDGNSPATSPFREVEDDMSDNTATHIEDVRTVSVPVSDVDRALEFYTKKLGFELRMDVPYGNGRRWIEVGAPGAATSIALAPPGPGQIPGVDTGIRFVTADVEADHADLEERGVDVDPEILRWPSSPPMFQLRDPDGNLLRVVQRLDEADSTGRGETGLKRFVVLVRSDEATESGAMPDEESLAAMTRFNEKLVDAGLTLDAEGLHPSSDGARIVFSDDLPNIVRGPFPEPKGLVAGYWVIQARSLDEAIDRMKTAPFPGGEEIEIRQVFEADEFGDALTPELREREERQRAKMAANAKRRAA
jgi:predicted enzyme related to lactoylglutathione lyase